MILGQLFFAVLDAMLPEYRYFSGYDLVITEKTLVEITLKRLKTAPRVRLKKRHFFQIC